jgi:hypothetical protein
MSGTFVLIREHWTETFASAGIDPPQMRRMTDAEFVRACDSLMEAGFPVPLLPDAMDEARQRIVMASIRESRAPIREEVFHPPTPSSNPFSGLFNFAYNFFCSNFSSDWARPPPLPAPVRPLPAVVVAPPNLPDPDRLMRHEQDRGFEAALYTQQQREIAAEARAHEEEERAEDRVAMRASIEIMFQEIGPEPTDGVRIAVMLPSRTRIIRRFLAADNAEMIFRWVSHEDEMFDADGMPKNFDLVNGIDIVRREATLEEQGMGRATLLSVMERD